MNGATAEIHPARRPGLALTLDTIRTELADLEGSLSDLQAALDPILRPLEPAPGPPELDDPKLRDGAELKLQAEDIAARIAGLVRRVQLIHGRADL